MTHAIGAQHLWEKDYLSAVFAALIKQLIFFASIPKGFT
jgi:hypothetical protein